MVEFLFAAFIIIVVLGIISASNFEAKANSKVCKPHKWALCDEAGWLAEDEPIGSYRWRGAALACQNCGTVPASDPRPSTGEY